jgi:translation initiation factor IF-3
LADSVVVEQFPKLEGRQMIMMLAPARKKAGGGACRQAGDGRAATAAAA